MAAPFMQAINPRLSISLPYRLCISQAKSYIDAVRRAISGDQLFIVCLASYLWRRLSAILHVRHVYGPPYPNCAS